MVLKNKTLLITGGSSGIGLEAAKQFLENGAKVIITGRNQQKLAAAKKLYPSLIAIQSDTTSEADANALYQQVVALGGIDILYHNAGVSVPPTNLGIPNQKHLEGAALEMEVNYFGIIRLNELFLPMLHGKGEAAIIHTTSLLSLVPSILEATYSASKTALSFYTKSLRAHLAIRGSKVKVFELLPPLVDTEMVAGRAEKKITPAQLVNSLINNLEKDNFTIRVGDSKAIYFLNRLAPKTAFGLVNKKKNNAYLNT